MIGLGKMNLIQNKPFVHAEIVLSSVIKSREMNFHPYAGPIHDHNLFRVSMIEYFFLFLFFPWGRTKDKHKERKQRDKQNETRAEKLYLFFLLKCPTSLNFF
jgi:hypothetical protein